MKKFFERLNYAMSLRDMNQTDLAKAIGVKPQAIQYLCTRGKRSVHSVKIAKVLRINPLWLTEGIGEIEENNKHIQEKFSDYKMNSSNQPPVIDKDAWKELPPKTQQLIINFLNTICPKCSNIEK